MKQYKRIFVPLALLDLDRGAISWASRIAGLAGTEHVLFIHALNAPDFPDEPMAKYPWLLAPLDETIRQKMEDLVHANWVGNPTLSSTAPRRSRPAGSPANSMSMWMSI